ncbi:MAG TPA: DUF2490 domain-containing protein [Steroidobacteraceae bacterium]|jgi:hypothetical protein
MLGSFAFAGAAVAETHYESWPELDLWYRLTGALRLELTGSGTRDDSGDRTDGTGAIYLDYRMNDPISWRVGFDYVNTLPDGPGQNNSVERRVSLDFNYRWHLGDELLLTDRTRLDLRNIEGDDSYRVRNRLRFERPFKLARTTLVPYFNAEAYYDSRYDTVSRVRLEAGGVVSLGKIWEADLYIGRQHDSAPADKDTVGFGITISAYF